MLDIGPQLRLVPQLQAYTALLPLGLAELDDALAREAALNPWLQIVERPLADADPDRIDRLGSAAPSLAEHLASQLGLADAPAAVRRAARYVIEALDRHAYLRDDDASIATQTGVRHADVRRAVSLVQTFEPLGVAARGLGERFRIQLRARGQCDAMTTALTFDLERLADEGVYAYASRSGIAAAAVREAVAVLRRLDPYPARDFGPSVDRAFPEIVAERDAAGWRVTVDDRLWPSLRLADLAPSRGLSVPMRAARVRARLLIDALSRRRQTIERLGRVAVERQRAFFDSAGDCRRLAPLSGRELAALVGCSESTVSRALASRFVATPFGTVALRALVVKRPGRVGATTRSVQATVKEIVATSGVALTDLQIARALAFRGIRLARRTVAKYRSLLGYAAARERRPP